MSSLQVFFTTKWLMEAIRIHLPPTIPILFRFERGKEQPVNILKGVLIDSRPSPKFARNNGDSSGVLALPVGGWREKLRGRGGIVGHTKVERKLSTSYTHWEERPPEAPLGEGRMKRVLWDFSWKSG